MDVGLQEIAQMAAVYRRASCPQWEGTPCIPPGWRPNKKTDTDTIHQPELDVSIFIYMDCVCVCVCDYARLL